MRGKAEPLRLPLRLSSEQQLLVIADIIIRGCLCSQSLTDGIICIPHLADEGKMPDKTQTVRSVSVVHEPEFSLASPGESLKQQMLPMLHPRAIGSASVGQRLLCWVGLMAPQVMAIYCQG